MISVRVKANVPATSSLLFLLAVCTNKIIYNGLLVSINRIKSTKKEECATSKATSNSE
jgi:hypothetical protein